MTDLLLISDVPRLSTLFNRLTEDKNIRLRIATSLEQGGEELASEKPGVVFVQTHLSGLSADILLMHLKKQLGRKRSKFVLLSNPAQAGDETLKLYQGHLDIALEDEELLESIKSMVSSLLTKGKQAVVKTDAVETLRAVPPPDPAASIDAVEEPDQASLDNPPTVTAVQLQAALPESVAPATAAEEPSLVEQGVTYAPRSRLSVYSEFNSSFDTVVSNMPPAEPLAQMPSIQDSSWNHEDNEEVQPENSRSKRATFLLWLAPVVIAVVVVTMLQHRRSKPAGGVAIKPESKAPVAATEALPKPAVVPNTPSPVPVTPAAPAVVAGKPPTAAPSANPATPAQKPSAETDARLGDKAVLSAIAENRGTKGPAGSRPSALPDFIPRSGHDKSYELANPGWERYKGQVTEFKVFREGGAIKAIQIIDRGGKGVPESFMRGVLAQVSTRPAFVKEVSERKDGYEIQRGKVADNLSVVMYRDEQGGRLRAFVLTWQ